jgi:DNA-binding winged helix-turn-helix (wHTH) protein/predicted Zn-dependent protease
MHQSISTRPGSETSGFSFAGFHLETDGTLLRGKTPVHLPPKELAALRLLLAHAGRIVTPLELRQALWGDVHVTADSVSKCVSSLRARLEPHECIQTIYKRGYRFTAEVRSEGTGPDGSGPERKRPRLAILPFATRFGVPEYVGTEIAEETMARLSSAQPALVSVLAQDSVFTLAGRGMTALETGEALGGDLVLAGTVSALPMHYRVRAEMISVEDGTQVWVEDLLVERGRTAGLESELVSRVNFRLGSTDPGQRLTENASQAVAASGLSIAAVAEDGPDSGHDQRSAYEIYQRARHEWQTMQRHRMQDGLQHLLRATEFDPSLAGARVDLVNLCVTQSFYGFMSPTVAADMVRRAAEASPDITARIPAILPALGWVRYHVDRDLPAALWAFERAAHLPHEPWITRARSMFLLSRHRFGEAAELLRGAIQQDPYSPWLQARLGWTLHLAGERDESVEQIERALRLFPDHEGARLYGTVILAYNGQPERATELSHALTEQVPYFDLATAVHAYALACAGQDAEARAILERLQWLGRERFLLRAFSPAAYVALGEPDAALAELRTSNENRCPWFFQMLADPRLKPLEGRPEFEQLKAIAALMEGEADRQAEAAS